MCVYTQLYAHKFEQHFWDTKNCFFFAASNGLPCSWAWGHKHNEDMKKAVMGGFNAKNA